MARSRSPAWKIGTGVSQGLKKKGLSLQEVLTPTPAGASFR